MADEYTPKNYEVRAAWQEYAFKEDGSHQDEFDRWLARHDREMRAKALVEAGAALLLVQEDVAAQPPEQKIWKDEAARAWQFGMSNARRLLREWSLVEK